MPTGKLTAKYNGGGGYLNCVQQKLVTHDDDDDNSKSSRVLVDVLIPPIDPGRKENRKRLSASPDEVDDGNCKELLLVLPNGDDILKRSNKRGNNRDRKVSNSVLQQLSDRISFDKNVVEERSPHTIPFAQWKAHKMYSRGIPKKNKINHNTLLQQRANEVKNSLPALSKDVNAEKLPKNSSSVSLVLGVGSKIDDSEILPSTQRKKCNNNIRRKSVKIEKDCLTAEQIWEQRVLSKLSRATLDLVLKDGDISKYGNSLCQKTPDSDVHQHGIITACESSKNMAVVNEANAKNNNIFTDSSDKYFSNIKTCNKNVRRKKKIQPAYPFPPSNWLENDIAYINNGVGRNSHGIQKWTGYPELIEEDELVLQKVSNIKLCEESKSLLTEKSECYDLLPVLYEWGKKWILAQQEDKKTFEELKSEMNHTSEHVRCAALLAVVMFISKHAKMTEEFNAILENEFVQLLLDDSHFVSLAAALSLFSMKKPNETAKNILMKNVYHGHSSERWVAVQCLAYYKHCDGCVIRELISNVTSVDKQKQEIACSSLEKLSHLTQTVQYMVAEKLNSGSWKDRVASCRVLPRLHGTLSKDIAGKLSYLFWNDWNKKVRKAALETLGKTGNGKLVHNTLCQHLDSVNTNSQVAALKMVGSLGVMTIQLLSRLLLCLVSEDDEVCLQCVKLCMKMKLTDFGIVKALICLLNSNRAVKIKIFILRALGEIGDKSDLVCDNLLWALHFSNEAVLRREACLTITKLNLCNKEIVEVLQEMVFTDEDASVQKEVALALCTMGVETLGNLPLTETIQKRMKELCCKQNVLARVVEGREENIEISGNSDNEELCNEDDGSCEVVDSSNGESQMYRYGGAL